jgi:hypothetical protein
MKVFSMFKTLIYCGHLCNNAVNYTSSHLKELLTGASIKKLEVDNTRQIRGKFMNEPNILTSEAAHITVRGFDPGQGTHKVVKRESVGMTKNRDPCTCNARASKRSHTGG